MHWWEYDALESKAPYDWAPATRGDLPWDQLDFHLDLGCGRVPKARMGIDLRPSPGATDLVIDLERLAPVWSDPPNLEFEARALEEFTLQHYSEMEYGPGVLPFPDCSIESIVSHHALEHIGPGFERLMEECYRILAWNGVMRVIVPLFPSYAAVSEYDHKRYFMEGTFMGFCQEPAGGPSYTDGFSERYNTCCFRQVDEWISAEEPANPFKTGESRELRVTLWKHPPETPGDYIPVPGDFFWRRNDLSMRP